MNKIHIKILSDDAIIFLKRNTLEVAKLVNDNSSNSWIFDFFPQPMFVEKIYEINDFDLTENPNSENKDIDFENSKKLYENLKILPRYILSDVRFWLWLHFDKFYNVVRSMMKINGKSTIENMWLHTQGVRRGLMFGVLSRCYYRVALSVDDTLDDKYELSKWIIDNPLRYRNLTWRSFSSEEHLVRGIIKGEKKAIEESQNNENNELYPIIAKYISRVGSVQLLDVISENDILNITYKKMKELINEDNINETVC